MGSPASPEGATLASVGLCGFLPCDYQEAQCFAFFFFLSLLKADLTGAPWIPTLSEMSLPPAGGAEVNRYGLQGRARPSLFPGGSVGPAPADEGSSGHPLENQLMCP